LNNEEKILNILTTLASDMYIVKAGQANLESSIEELKAGQSNLEAGQTRLEAGQAKLEDRQTRLEAGQAKLEDRQTRLEAGQAKLEDRQAKLEAGQARLEIKVNDIEAIALATHNNLVRLESDYNSVRGVLFDKMDDLGNKVNEVKSEIVDIKKRLDTDEMYIRVVDNKLRLGLTPSTAD